MEIPNSGLVHSSQSTAQLSIACRKYSKQWNAWQGTWNKVVHKSLFINSCCEGWSLMLPTTMAFGYVKTMGLPQVTFKLL